MPSFRYQATTAAGELIDGQFDAFDEVGVVRHLHRLNLLPIRIHPAHAPRWKLLFSAGPKLRPLTITQRDVFHLTRGLGTLLGSGIELERALELLMLSAPREGISRLLSQILEAVRGGSTLTDALKAHPTVFSHLYTAMIHAGEVGGALSEACVQIAQYQERSQKTGDEIKTALIYPTILLLTAFASVFVLVAFVLPRFEPLFSGAGVALPLPTKLLMSWGSVMATYWWVAPVAVLLAVFGSRYAQRDPQTKEWVDRRVLTFPVIGGMILLIQISQLTRTLASLLRNGVPVLAAVVLAKDAIANRYLSHRLGEVALAIKGGKRLSDELSRLGFIPPMALQLIKLGEESGQLEQMLQRTAEIYEEETATRIKRCMSLLTPCITIALGLLVAGMISSIMLALLSLNEMAI